MGAAKGLKTAGLVAPKSRPSEGHKRTETSGYVDLMLFCRLIVAMRSRGKPWKKVQRASKARPVPARWNVTILRGIDTGKIVRTCKEYSRNAALRAAFWVVRPPVFSFYRNTVSARAKCVEYKKLVFELAGANFPLPSGWSPDHFL